MRSKLEGRGEAPPSRAGPQAQANGSQLWSRARGWARNRRPAWMSRAQRRSPDGRREGRPLLLQSAQGAGVCTACSWLATHTHKHTHTITYFEFAFAELYTELYCLPFCNLSPPKYICAYLQLFLKEGKGAYLYSFPPPQIKGRLYKRGCIFPLSSIPSPRLVCPR